jgi:hypothetical protein
MSADEKVVLRIAIEETEKREEGGDACQGRHEEEQEKDRLKLNGSSGPVA